MHKKSVKGTLIIIGGGEDKERGMDILREVANRVKGKLVIASVASTIGDELWATYRRIFRKLGVKEIVHLAMVDRKAPTDQKAMRLVRGAGGVFFTGGDQLRITSELSGTEVADEIQRIYEHGGLIAGTSAGASVMSDTMLVSGKSETSFRIGSSLKMAPGLGFVKNMIIDQHFAERGRINRLIGAVAHNPKFLGIGIDEDTAIIMENEKEMQVIGNGAVYVLDAHHSSDSNISEASPDATLSIHNVNFHVLCAGCAFNLEKRIPFWISKEMKSA